MSTKLVRWFTAVAVFATAVLVAGCEDFVSPGSEVIRVPGAYTATWRISTTSSAIEAVCPGSLNLEGKDSATEFSGSFVIRSTAGSGCESGSPISGSIPSGQVRADGGLDFEVEVPDTERTTASVFGEVFAELGVNYLLPGSCVIERADTELVGAFGDGVIEASGDAFLRCTVTVINADGEEEEKEIGIQAVLRVVAVRS